MGGCDAQAGRYGSWLSAELRPAPPRRVALVEMDDSNAFEEGVVLASEQKFAEAEDKFAKVLRWSQATGDRERSAESMFWLAFCKEKRGREAEARDLYAKLLKEYPGAAAARLASDRRAHLPAAARVPAKQAVIARPQTAPASGKPDAPPRPRPPGRPDMPVKPG
jgi:tetratricopeptide (TPR) repeat protein